MLTQTETIERIEKAIMELTAYGANSTTYLREVWKTVYALFAENERLKERLEITSAYNGNGEKIPFDHSFMPDGIEARDTTIKLLEDRIRELRKIHA